MAKKHYFVSVDSKEIRDVAIDDNNIEYEVIGDGQDIQEIEEHFANMEGHTAESLKKMFINPVDEQWIDKELDSHGDALHNLYQKIYDIGTEDTKQKISELGIIN